MFDKLFEPLYVKSLKLKNRIIMTPMTVRYETEKGYVSERLKQFYVERAKGGAALVGTTQTMVHPDNYKYLALYDDKFIPGWKDLARAIHDSDSKLAPELNHMGRKTDPKDNSTYAVAPSSINWVPMFSYSYAIPRRLPIEEIKNLEEAFANAAKRAKDAGCDAVIIQGAHGYLIWQFLSPLANKRTDEYGNDSEGRVKFACETVERTRKKVGENYPIMIRISGSDYEEGSITINDAKYIARRLEEAGADALAITATETTVRFPGQYMIQPRAIPLGCNVHLAAKIKEVVDIPVAIAGRINTPELAENILKERKADIIFMGRALIADPEFPNKAMEGRSNEIRPCIACNHCEDSTVAGFAVECAVNALAGQEWRYTVVPSKTPKRVLVIGGGPAGMEAATVVALKGHEITLVEKDDELGGQLRWAAKAPYGEEIQDLVEHYKTILNKLGVKTKLGCKVTSDLIQELNPETIIVATGVVPYSPPISEAGLDSIVTAKEVLLDKVRVNENVLIIGGGYIGCTTADSISEKGKKVTIIERRDDLGIVLETVKGLNEKLLIRRLGERNVKILIKSEVDTITREGVIVRRRGERQLIKGDTVVLAEVKADRRVIDLAKKEFSNTPIHEVGDCVKPRKLVDAIHEGFMTANYAIEKA